MSPNYLIGERWKLHGNLFFQENEIPFGCCSLDDMSYIMLVKVPPWGLLIEVLVQWGFLTFRNIVLWFILLVSSPLFSPFTTLIDSLFCPSHQLKLYLINLTKEIFMLQKYKQSFPSNCQQKPICCEMLLSTFLCLWFTGLETVYLKCHFLEWSGVNGQSLWPNMLCFKMFIWH